VKPLGIVKKNINKTLKGLWGRWNSKQRRPFLYVTHLFYVSCIHLWHGKESKTITMPKPVMGPNLPQYLCFISFLFTTATLLVKYYSKNFPNAQW